MSSKLSKTVLKEIIKDKFVQGLKVGKIGPNNIKILRL